MKRALTVVSELYYPEQTSTGYFLTRISEGLAEQCKIEVICSQPTYSERGTRSPWNERRSGVFIRRCWGTTLSKDSLAGRFLNMVSFCISVCIVSLRRIRKDSNVLVVTNPPLVPYIVVPACKIKGARSFILVHDVYPEVLIASGFLREGSAAARWIGYCTRLLLNSAFRVIVIGRDMRQLIEKRYKIRGERARVITNWADTNEIHPEPKKGNLLLKELGLEDRFVVQYCGNMGRTHGLQQLMEAAEILQLGRKIHFLLIGWGAKRSWVEKHIESHKLSNVTILPHQARERLNTALNACDLAVISFVAGMAGISVPSRMYNIMAAGKPILAVADEESELAMVVREEQIGWVVPPGQTSSTVQAIEQASADQDCLKEMGRRARGAAEGKYSFERIVELYTRMLDE